MTEENLQTSAAGADDAEATIVKPFFDEAATETARPVVPLPARPASSPFALSSYTPRSWVIALVVISALIGGVLGGIGLSLYQKSRSASAFDTNAPAAQPATEDAASLKTTAAESAQVSGTTAQTNEAQAQTHSEVAVSGQTEEAPAPQLSVTSEATSVERTMEVKKRDEASKPASSDDDEDKDEDDRARQAGRRGRGRGDDDDDDERAERAEQSRRRAERNAEPSRAARPEHARGEPTAYRVDSYVVREQRRAARREARQQQRIEQQPRDRVRAIFEGPTP